MSEKVAALAMDLHGQALVEASAGTGKTWTLTAVILRLLLERHLPARAIVATTFTRKAAAEMRRRVQQRLSDFLTRCDQEDLGELEDPLERHLFLDLKLDRDTLHARCAIALRELNQLFIGTLDGLCKRWLQEYALETGVDEGAEIDSGDEVAGDLTHDCLRAYHWQLARWHLPSFSHYLVNRRGEALREFVHAIDAASSFGRAEFDTLELPPVNGAEEEQLRRQLAGEDGAELLAFINECLATKKIRSNGKLANNRAELPGLMLQLQRGRKLSEKQERLAAGLAEGLDDTTFKKTFNKGAEAEAERFQRWPLVQLLRRLYQLQEQRKGLSKNLERQALLHSARELRQRLGPALEKLGRSTYALNQQRLNDGLADRELCRYLRHRYPAMLVDESQDLNGEQALMLEQIYLREREPDRCFLLLVGDPKQAIYRFRGGDVANYNRLKGQFQPEEIYQLTENRRSSPNLIDALNFHYRNPVDLGQDINYQPMRALAGPRRLTDWQGQALAQPLIWLEEKERGEGVEQVADTVRWLLSPASPYRYDGQPLRPGQLLLLAPRNEQLAELSQALLRRGIANELEDKNSLFAKPMARELAILLYAMLNPSDGQATNALLSSAFFNLPLADLAAGPPLQEELAKAFDRWQRYGLLSALHEFCGRFHLWENLAGHRPPANRQNLLHFRALLTVIGQQAPKRPPPAFYQWWLNQLEQPPERYKAPNLSGEETLSLLTIHRAKGLQAPLVLLYGLQAQSNRDGDRPALRRYYRDKQLRLTVNPDADTSEQLKQEEKQELARQIYVALTRAEDLLIVFHREKNSPLEVLQPKAPHPHSGHELPPARPRRRADEVPVAPDQSLALTIAPRHFSGWQRTSFTALARQRQEIGDDNYDDGLDQLTAPPEPAAAGPESTLLRFQFPRGKEAGSFLHKIFERLNPQQPQRWPQLLKYFGQQYQIDVSDEAGFMGWFEEIFATPLASGVRLRDIDRRRRSNELAFALALDSHRALDMQAINQLFAAYGHPIYLQADRRFYGYLRGEIDLVYGQDGRYFIIDYKSNYLGNRWADYQGAALHRAMAEHQYFLQAAIYQLALYRQLRTMANFSMEMLGPVEYCFLRGLDGEHGSGRYCWDMPADFLRAFDQLLGHQNGTHR